MAKTLMQIIEKKRALAKEWQEGNKDYVKKRNTRMYGDRMGFKVKKATKSM